MKSQTVRVRFAPSPTGPLHIGGMRTALFNYLFAKQNKGVFILRIEDTDRTRYVDRAEQYIFDALAWCGIRPDEGVREGGEFGPYRQSERKETYNEYARLLLESGHAYKAFDTPEDLGRIRHDYESEGKTFRYDASVRNRMKNTLSLGEEEAGALRDQGVPAVIRFMMPEERDIAFSDIVRDEVSVNTSTLDDKVLLKADGMPTYHLANVVDDHLMEISHVIRGEEWLPSTPLHVALYEAFGWTDSMPQFAHMPLTLKPDGKGKLSKRDGDRLGFPVFPLEWVNEKNEKYAGYRESGYLPEAVINILAMLGWNSGTDKELFTMEELIEEFSLDRIIRAGSRFDPEKARWFNHQYLVEKSDGELARWLSPRLQAEGLEFGMEYISAAVGMIKERAFLLEDLWTQSRCLFVPPERYDEKVAAKVWKEGTGELVRSLRKALDKAQDFSPDALKSLVGGMAGEKGIGMGKILNPLRLLLVGTSAGPGLFEMMSLLGREETLARIDKGLSVLGGK